MKNIVHVIDSLARGGAETLLINLLPDLSKHYNIILVTLSDKNEFDESVFNCCFQHYCLHHTGHFVLLRTVSRLKKIIRQYQPILVRSDLIWSTIIARLACPKKIPFVFNVHITMDVFNETLLGPVLAAVEKATLSKRQVMIGVTKEVVEGYKKKFNFKGPTFILYNYVKDGFFKDAEDKPPKKELRLLAVGNLRPQKNYQLLIEAFKLLKGKNISIDIFGEGSLNQSLSEQIKEYGLAINLKGQSGNIYEFINDYDAFVMVSFFEGFGIVVAEAMAAGLPLILSNLPVLKEVTANQAFFIDPHNPITLVDLLKSFLRKEQNIMVHVDANKKMAREKYSKRVYLENTLAIYEKSVCQS